MRATTAPSWLFFLREFGDAIDKRLIRGYAFRPETVKSSTQIRFRIKSSLSVKLLRQIAHAMAGMSRSTLHHHFRGLTAMSPLQFQKQLRLHTSRQKMLTEELDAASAAFEVGYEGPSQFNREYKRVFGKPPCAMCRHCERPCHREIITSGQS
jgi:AraC-like DNA-binding protein